MYLAWPALGQPQKPIELDIGPASFIWKLPKLHCSADQLARVAAVVGRPLTKDEIRTVILEAGTQAKTLAEQAWFKLHTKTLPADIEKLFVDSFGAASTARPTSGATMHRIVVTRYEGAITKVSDDSLNVSCWGWPWGGGTKDEPEKYFGRTLDRRHGIALGKLFWLAVQKGDTASPAATLLGSALHLFYYRLKFRASARTVRSACYLRFAFRAAGQPVPDWIQTACG